MSLNRTGKLIVSTCGAALVVAAVGVVVLTGSSKRAPGGNGKQPQEVVPAKIGPGSPITLPAVETLPSPQGPIGPPVLEKGETFFGKGESLYHQGEFTEATRYLKEEVGQHPDRFYPTYLLGIAQWKDGSLDDAIATLQESARLDTGSVKARINLGRVLGDAGRHEESLEAAGQALAIDPGSSQAQNVRGRALLNLGRKDEAIDSFRTAVEKDPANAFAQNNLGYALIRTERFAEAVPFLEEAVRLKPGVGYFQNNLGMAYERTGDTTRAKSAYQAAIIAGGSPAAESNLARIGGTTENENGLESVGTSSN